MTRDRSQQLLSVTNASGFPFQLGVQRLVEQELASWGWKVLAREHPWTDPESGRVEFIDLVLERRGIRLVVECKRVKQGLWIFLNPRDGMPSTERARFFATLNAKEGRKESAWVDCIASPSSIESSFCVVRGSGDSDRPLLERLAAQICRATEAFGRQELEVEPSGSLDLPTAYVPVIISNTELVTCRADANKVDLTTGSLSEAHVEFNTRSFVRFRKSLGLHRDLSTFIDVRYVNWDAERTVVVASACDLKEALGDFGIRDVIGGSLRDQLL